MSFLLQGTPQVSTKNTSNQSSGLNFGTSNTGVTLSPQMQQMADALMNYGTQSMQNPMGQLAPIRNAGLQAINQQYAGVPDQVSRAMASRGYGSSGAMGNAMFNTNLQRAGAASGLEGQLATMGQQQSQFGGSLSQSLLNSLKGSTQNYSASSSGSSTGTEKDVTPGQSPLGAIAQLFGVVSQLGGVGKLFGGGSGSNPASGSYGSNYDYSG